MSHRATLPIDAPGELSSMIMMAKPLVFRRFAHHDHETHHPQTTPSMIDIELRLL